MLCPRSPPGFSGCPGAGSCCLGATVLAAVYAMSLQPSGLPAPLTHSAGMCSICRQSCAVVYPSYSAVNPLRPFTFCMLRCLLRPGRRLEDELDQRTAELIALRKAAVEQVGPCVMMRVPSAVPTTGRSLSAHLLAMMNTELNQPRAAPGTIKDAVRKHEAANTDLTMASVVPLSCMRGECQNITSIYTPNHTHSRPYPQQSAFLARPPLLLCAPACSQPWGHGQLLKPQGRPEPHPPAQQQLLTRLPPPGHPHHGTSRHAAAGRLSACCACKAGPGLPCVSCKHALRPRWALGASHAAAAS